jgi:hypothetical protein
MNVSVTARQASDGSIDWEIDGKKPEKSELEFKAKSGSDLIHFMLDDQTGRDLRFHPTDAFWAEKDLGGGCPAAGSSCDQTRIQSCNDTELVVHNDNSGAACTVHYQLNLLDKENSAIGVDPIIKNGGSA